MSKVVDIVLPEGQLEGTSATLATWLVKEGDRVKEGDPVAELETDKVVMEVCAVENGQIQSLSANVGDDVVTEQVLGKITTEVGAGSISPQQDKGEENNVVNLESATNETDGEPGGAHEHAEQQSAREFISPAVRRLLRENNLTIDYIRGTGKRGRVTRDDVIAYLKNPTPKPAPKTEGSVVLPTKSEKQPTVSPGTPAAKTASGTSPYSTVANRESRPLEGTRVPHSQMRKSIASHMVESLLHTSPHVTSVFEMDMTNIIEHRKWHKKEFEALGVKLTFTAYFLSAMAAAVKQVPQVNARFHDDSLEIFNDVNIGVGTALGDSGLVVPVVEQVQEMNLFEIAQNLNKQTEKARDGKLTPADMRNGTITISNHGVSGSLFAAPIIINQPQVAILGVGKLEKRVVVEPVSGVDTMVIKPKCYVSLSIDHRALDAHQTNLFLSAFVEIIENWGQ
ncbi:dihydrolipoamide acetyltransferase family protein [Aliikangiella coralliicola]|uniref:Dihydrolipoamide acetyltransferase component of pyruvate dehydrogenase complex n=1 Tax=Aliikangiella coralliicola TaxID=2592383 RepID=A0A545U523_9GAMM|nr:2-oxo acid dehydrogenase subunit E2 [Aliikangiella coralliicola]TQV84571.1 biotin/lipoyl-binding protein [Aliikangiella coralliicola]